MKKKVKIQLAPYMIGLIFVVFFSIFHLANLGRTLFYEPKTAHDQDLAALPSVLPKYTYKSCQVGKKVSADMFDGKLTPEKITINKVDIDLSIVPVPLKNGTWKVYPTVANYAQGTSLINGKSGNVGIFAHDRKDAFARIKELKDGDLIEIYSAGHLIKYRVQLARVVEPTDVDIFFETSEPTVTLVTCDGDFSEQRYVVRAELTEIEEINCNEEN